MKTTILVLSAAVLSGLMGSAILKLVQANFNSYLANYLEYGVV